MKLRMRILLGLALLGAMSSLLWPVPARAWRHGWAVAPYVGSPWGFYSPRPPYDYRYSLPPGAPLSTYDPASGTTSCLSPSTGLYYVCGYAPSGPPPAVPLMPAPASAIAPFPPPPASGLLLFRLPPGTGAAVDGVPIGLSDGLGAVSVAAGPHRILTDVSGQQTERSVTILPHKIFTVTPAAITANEP